VDADAIALASADDAPAGSTAAQEAISALINLGYARPQAATAIAASVKALGEGAETAALIRRGLKELATI
jgi:Holliday junction DNA helicase RuvA